MSAEVSSWPLLYSPFQRRLQYAIDLWFDPVAKKEVTISEVAAQYSVPLESMVHALSSRFFEIGEVEIAQEIAGEYLNEKSDPLIHSQFMRCMMANPSTLKKDFLHENLMWRKRYVSQDDTQPDSAFVHLDLNPNKKLRIGILCCYANTTLTRYAMLPVFSELPKDQFETVFFNLDAPCVESWMEEGVDELVTMAAPNDDGLFDLIKDKKIDVLVDLNGRFRIDNPINVLIRRPAPVQVSYGNMVGTYALDSVKYIFADRYSILEDDRKYFTEKIYYFPCDAMGTFNMPKSRVTSPPCLNNQPFTFCSFNGVFKINDLVLETWVRILERVPNSRLYIKSNGLDAQRLRLRFKRMFDKYGVDNRRGLLEGFTPFDDMLQKYQNADLALNPFPYSGGTTAAYAAWQGVPSLTMANDPSTIMSGGGPSVMLDLGLDEFIANGVEDYINKAVDFASDKGKILKFRTGMRDRLNKSARFCPPLFAKEFGDALRWAWQDWLDEASF